MNPKPTLTLLAIICLTTTVVTWKLYNNQGSPVAFDLPANEESLTNTETLPPTPPITLQQGDVPAPEVPEESIGAATEDPSCIPNTRWFEHPITGELLESDQCYPSEEADPYQTWDDATLVGMAYADAHAAEVLGLRHIRSEDRDTEAMGLALLYRSVGLSGDPETFKKAIGARYAYISINGEPQVHNLKQQLLFKLVGQTMGNEWFDPQPVVRKLREAGVPAADIDQARLAARQILESMADLQTEMTGDSTLREALEQGALIDA